MKTRAPRIERVLSVVMLAAALAVFAPVLESRAAATEDPAATPGAQTPWTTVAASGHVLNRQSGDAWNKVRRGDTLLPESLIKTGQRGRATVARDANIIIVDPSTEIILPESHLVGEPSRIVQTSGTAVYEVEPGSETSLEVVTPYLVAGVKGTVFGVTVNERFTLVSVEEGAVEVRSALTGETVYVRAGEAVRSSANSEMEVVRDEVIRNARDARSPKLRKIAHKRHRDLIEVAARPDILGEDDDEKGRKNDLTVLLDEDANGRADKERVDKLDDLLDSVGKREHASEVLQDVRGKVKKGGAKTADPTHGGS